MEALAGFVWIITALRGAVAACGHHGAFGPPKNGFAHAIHARLGRLAARFAALVAKFEAGALEPPRKPGPRPTRERRSAPKIALRAILPCRFGFAAAGGYEIRGHASRLAHFLSQPDIATLIAADPRFGRVLRPLCHMLGIAAPPGIRLPARPRKPRPRNPSLRFQRSFGSPEPCATPPRPRPPTPANPANPSLRFLRPSAGWLAPPGPKVTLTRWMPPPNRRSRAPPGQPE
ncbi:hypothetical protein [Acidiphilium iwatense]|nr:hypothetical protein [Acidiphilium iwatense]